MYASIRITLALRLMLVDIAGYQSMITEYRPTLNSHSPWPAPSRV